MSKHSNMILITIIVHHLNIFIVSSVVDHFSNFGQLCVRVSRHICLYVCYNKSDLKINVCVYMYVYLYTSDCESDYFLRIEFYTHNSWVKKHELFKVSNSTQINCKRRVIDHSRTQGLLHHTLSSSEMSLCKSVLRCSHSFTRLLLPRITGMEGGGPVTQVLLHLLPYFWTIRRTPPKFGRKMGVHLIVWM